MGAKDRRELRELAEQVVVMAEAMIALAFDKGYAAGTRDARTPLERRRTGLARQEREPLP